MTLLTYRITSFKYFGFTTTSASMPFAPLTSPFVRAATCPKDRAKVDFFDTEQKGFLLEVRSSGGKTFYQRYVDAHGRQRQFKLGSADVLSVEQARRLGRSALAEALLGADPQARRSELRSIPTLTQLVRDRYLPHAKANKRSWHIDELNLRLHILPALGRLMLDEITSEHIAHMIEDMRQAGYAGGTRNRVLMLAPSRLQSRRQMERGRRRRQSHQWSRQSA